ncbi:MAG: hypothetical protein ACYCSP_14900 [Acidobacteriaceae bacterium]
MKNPFSKSFDDKLASWLGYDNTTCSFYISPSWWSVAIAIVFVFTRVVSTRLTWLNSGNSMYWYILAGGSGLVFLSYSYYRIKKIRPTWNRVATVVSLLILFTCFVLLGKS